MKGVLKITFCIQVNEHSSHDPSTFIRHGCFIDGASKYPPRPIVLNFLQKKSHYNIRTHARKHLQNSRDEIGHIL